MLLACCIGLCAVTVPSRAMAQHPPASRAAPAPTPGTHWISVSWTAPAGSTGTTAYNAVSYDVLAPDLSGQGAAGANSPPSGRPTINGKAQAGHILTADTSNIADADGLENATLTYQWLAIWGATEVVIQGVTERAYTVTGDDIGARIALTVSFSDDQGNRERLTSSPTSEIESAWPYEVLHPPFNLAQVWWWWRYNGDCTGAFLEFETVTVDFTIHNDPNYSTRGGMFLMLLNGNISGKSFYFGLQTRLQPPLGRPAAKGTLFSRWDTRDQGNAAADSDHGWTYDGGYEGDFVSARRSYEWSAGDYRARLARDSSRESNADGVWYGLWFTDLDTNVETWIGSLRFPLVEGETHIQGLFSTVLEIYGGAVRPADVPAWHVSVGIPAVDGVEAGCAQTRYPDVEAEDVTSEVRYDPDQRRMHLEAFGSTGRQTSQQVIFFPDRAGSVTLSSAPPHVGETLRAGLHDSDGFADARWQWSRGATPTGAFSAINGATESSYTPASSDVGMYLQVAVTYSDGHGPGKRAEAASSDPVRALVVNRPPAFPLPSVSFRLDHAAGPGVIVGTVGATDADGDRLTYSLSGPDAAFFAIDSDTGQIRTAAGVSFDAEVRSQYRVRVHVDDGQGGADTVDVVITVTARPTILPPIGRPVVRRSSGTGPFSIVENSGTDVGRFVATDPEGGGVTWSLATTGDHGRFEIDAANGALSFKEAPDFESDDLGIDEAYTVTVQATEQDDGDTQTRELTGSLAVTVTITNVNEPPVVTRRSGAGPFSVVENSGTDVGAFEATDPEGGGVTWSLATSGDHGRFEIDEANGALSFKELPDFESDDLGIDEAYNVTVRATEVDDGDTQTLELTGRLAVTVAVTDVNEPPTVTGNATPSVDENTTAVATYSATDPEEVPPSWSLQGGAGVFMITSAGALAFTTAPNYEVESSYTVTVRASDGVKTTNHSVTVTVTDEDETEKLKLSARRPFIAIAYTAAFEEGTGDAVQSPMWAWERSPNGTSSWDDITGATAATYRPVGDDRDHYLRVTASYNDGHSAKTLQATSESPTLPDISTNMPPVFPSPLFAGGATGLSVDENATAGTVVGLAPQATDPELGTLDYSLAVTGFTTDPPFEINATSRQIQVAGGAALDHEDHDRYSVTVTAEDEYTATGTATFDITVEDVNERPVAVFDIPPATDEDTATTFAVLGNDIDQDDGDTLTVSITSQPSRGRVVADTTTQLVTYTPAENDHGTYTFMYTASDGTLSSLPAQVTVTVNPVNDAPAFAAATAERTVSENAPPGANVGVPVTATDVDGDLLGYRIQGAPDFEIDEQTGQITVAEGAALNVALSPYIVTVTADDGGGSTATVEVTITVTARPVVIITGGGGGGGGGGPTPSDVDFEWNVKRDIEELDGGNDRATGVWSDGTTLWVADNADGAGDAVYAYDRETGERVEEREFTLAKTNRAPRGFWSDRSVVWVSDSGRERLFAYRLADGERLEEREFALAERNSDARGIWSDEETMWVLDGRADALFVYDFESGELLAEYELDAANDDPRGIWSDGVTIWVSDHGAKHLIAYRLPVLPDAETDSGEEDADDDARELERASDEEFTELSKASNNSPRGIWSDGDVMYVADESDDRVYSYNMPDAIDARLASLTLSGVDFGEFDPGQPDYEAVVADGVTETAVEAEAMRRRTDVAIDPPDADTEADGHQVALQDLGEITVTVTSQDGSRKKTYRVQFPETAWDPARDAWPHCLRGAVSEGFSLVVYEGGSVEELIGCAESRDIVTLYALHEGVFVSYILGAPGFVNAGFVELFPDGLPPITPLIVGSNGPPSADPFADLEDGGQQPWPECLRGAVSEGFSLVVYEGGGVDELEACAQSRDVAALYALSDGVFVSNILGAPAFVTQPFRDLFAEGLPPMTPLVARSEGPPGGR